MINLDHIHLRSHAEGVCRDYDHHAPFSTTNKHSMTTDLLDLICKMQVEGYERWRPRW